MKITVESTDNLADINGALCRLWNGVTSDGRRCYVFVRCVAVPDGEDPEQFKKELLETQEPVILPASHHFPVQFSDN